MNNAILIGIFIALLGSLSEAATLPLAHSVDRCTSALKVLGEKNNIRTRAEEFVKTVTQDPKAFYFEIQRGALFVKDPANVEVPRLTFSVEYMIEALEEKLPESKIGSAANTLIETMTTELRELLNHAQLSRLLVASDFYAQTISYFILVDEGSVVPEVLSPQKILKRFQNYLKDPKDIEGFSDDIGASPPKNPTDPSYPIYGLTRLLALGPKVLSLPVPIDLEIDPFLDDYPVPMSFRGLAKSRKMTDNQNMLPIDISRHDDYHLTTQQFDFTHFNPDEVSAVMDEKSIEKNYQAFNQTLTKAKAIKSTILKGIVLKLLFLLSHEKSSYTDHLAKRKIFLQSDIDEELPEFIKDLMDRKYGPIPGLNLSSRVNVERVVKSAASWFLKNQ